MLLIVTFVHVDCVLREEKFQEKKATIPLHLLLSLLVNWKLCGHRRTIVLGDINE
jgi:hypothetical protein